MRLTNEFRDELIGRALMHAFGKREKAHKAATVALADAIYAHEWGEAGKIADKLPQGWVHAYSELRIIAAGFGYPHNKEGLQSHILRMSKSRRVPRSVEVTVGGAHLLNDQAQTVAAGHAAIRDEKEALRVKLRALVYSVTTLARLREAWPECEQFLPEAAPRPSTALVPVELVPDLNKALGLLTPRK